MRLLPFLLILTKHDCILLPSLKVEVVGGNGRIGSQFMRLLGESTSCAVPRGAAPGSLSRNGPIFVCTPAAAWPNIIQLARNHHRQPDLVFVGNGLVPTGIVEDVTVVVPHYAILKTGAKPLVATGAPPTYVFGKHAEFVKNLLTSDGVGNVQILDDAKQICIVAAQKLLWGSCLWLLCHAQDPPCTVQQVHDTHRRELQALVHELWPSFSKITNSKQAKFEDVMQYMESYSNSIANAIPSLDLAIKELSDRNGLFALPDQVLHQQLIEKVAGTNALYIFEPDKRDQDKQNDTS